MNSKATLYLDTKLLKAAKIKAAHTEQSLSYLVNEALKLSLLEDAAPYGDFEKGGKEPARKSLPVLDQPMVSELVEQRLLEILGDPEESFKLSPVVKKRLMKRYSKKDLLSAEQAASQLGLKW
jgi:hypothetical protein